MDPLAHTLTGAALAGAGLRRVAPRATATLILAVNAPDVDVLSLFGGDYFSLAFRRGWTHGVLAMAVLPFVVVACVVAYDSLLARLRRRTTDPPIRSVHFTPLLGLALLGVLTHPAMDWLNTYGVRLLSPFSGRWFYGDALFIIDPWVWLGLGAAASLSLGRTPGKTAGWIALAALASAPVLLVPFVTPQAKLTWLGGLGLIAGLRLRLPSQRTQSAARFALAAVGIYIGSMIVASLSAERGIAGRLADEQLHAHEVMFQPDPANPFAGSYVARTAAVYHLGAFSWLDAPTVRAPDRTLVREPSHPALPRAVATTDARHFLTWSRYPYFDVREAADTTLVFIGDARFARERSGLGGLTVRVPR